MLASLTTRPARTDGKRAEGRGANAEASGENRHPRGARALKWCAPSPGSDGRRRRYLIVSLCLPVWHRLQIQNVWVRALWGGIPSITANTILFANPADCPPSGSRSPSKQTRAKNKRFPPTAVSPEHAAPTDNEAVPFPAQINRIGLD